MPSPADNYIITRDASEADRLDLQHRLTIACQGYYLHPDIPKPEAGTRVADVATGSVVFLRDVAPAYPAARFHGFDISDKMFPPASELPSNIALHVADVREPFDNRWQGYFDIVHIRLIMAAMTMDSWPVVMRNLVSLLKPGGWLQWVEDDRAHAVRHAARPVAPFGAAKDSLLSSQGEFVPPRLEHLAQFNRTIMDNERAHVMTYGYMNLDVLMKDPTVGNLEQVNRDIYVIDRQDDAGRLRQEWAAMGISAVVSMMKSRKESGNSESSPEHDEIAHNMLKDIEDGAYYVVRSGVFIGRKIA